MAPSSTQARTAEGFRTLRRRRAAARGNPFISRGYHVLETPIGPKSYRRLDARQDEVIPTLSRPRTKRERDALGQRLQWPYRRRRWGPEWGEGRRREHDRLRSAAFGWCWTAGSATSVGRSRTRADRPCACGTRRAIPSTTGARRSAGVWSLLRRARVGHTSSRCAGHSCGGPVKGR
jgi:hypothetical protein